MDEFHALNEVAHTSVVPNGIMNELVNLEILLLILNHYYYQVGMTCVTMFLRYPSRTYCVCVVRSHGVGPPDFLPFPALFTTGS